MILFIHYRIKKVNCSLTLSGVIIFKELLQTFSPVVFNKKFLAYFRIGEVRTEALYKRYMKQNMEN